jgi:hypothetical protein
MKEHTVITEHAPVPVFGRDGDPCPDCGAPLAGDQRYCLHCGARRPEARLEFLDVLDADVRVRGGGGGGVVLPPAGGFGSSPPPPPGLNGRIQANAGVLALGALLLLMLLIGLLVGHWATGDKSAPAAATPAPQVIRVEGGVAPTSSAPASTDAGATSDAAAAGTAKTKAKSKRSSSSSSSDKATAPKDSVSVGSLKSKKAVDDAVKKGKPISTGTGTLPPKDDKAAGGGSDFEEIG